MEITLEAIISLIDQLILEHNAKGSYWVHVSYRADGLNRKQVINNLLKK